MKYTHMRHKGFTLVELIVSIGLFAIVVTIAMTAYLRLISLERQSRTTNDLSDNLSTVVDSMARGIRTGSVYKCNGVRANCSAGTSFSYTDYTGSHTVAYSLANSAGTGVILESYDSATPVAVTDPRINIQSMYFYVKGIDTSSGPDGIEPQVVFTIQGTLKSDPNIAPTTFTIESGATQRNLDL